ncbi:MAG: hypothetical protein VX899_08935 [Myxococcota bacterium]|nr:hypothetical protein [Myxococcota bacterium]
MREFVVAAALAFGLLACIDGGFPIDSAETGGAVSGCCEYACGDGTGGCVVTSDLGECESTAEINCSGEGQDVSSVSFDESCTECAR